MYANFFGNPNGMAYSAIDFKFPNVEFRKIFQQLFVLRSSTYYFNG